MDVFKKTSVSVETKKRQWLFRQLFLVGIAVIFSSTYYFSFGYQVVRNPDYGKISFTVNVAYTEENKMVIKNYQGDEITTQ